MHPRGKAICAVVPAAGRGTRLGGSQPKLLASLGNGETVWSVLSRKLLAVADHLNLIVSPAGFAPLHAIIEREGLRERVSLSIQPEPIGMGDAIFRGHAIWAKAAAILVVWGDQVFVSRETLRAVCSLHDRHDATIVLPLVALAQPYVEYLFDSAGRLCTIRQSREGDRCKPHGWGDIGSFALSVDGLETRWREYMSEAPVGAITGEINFLPFLPWLAAREWIVRRLVIADPLEARGINTPEDQAFFQSLMRAQREAKGMSPDE